MANDARTTINICADIPTKQFHAQPMDPNFGRDETMNYNPVNGELSSLRVTFDLKSTDGSVHAYIELNRSLLVHLGTLKLADLPPTANPIDHQIHGVFFSFRIQNHSDISPHKQPELRKPDDDCPILSMRAHRGVI